MNLNKETSEIYIPDHVPIIEALARTTHLCFAAHQDDIEIMAAEPILECFHQKDKWFTGVVLTDGRGSPRNGSYAQTTDEEMRLIRISEQRKAAFIGNYSALIFLDYPSSEIKNASNSQPVEDLLQILCNTRPIIVYTHNFADKHDTHVAVSLRAMQALRLLDASEKPEKVIGCEVWRSLDWVNDNEKVVMDLSAHENQQQALLSVFDSQIAGGKRYDLAAMNRRQANATFFESHGVDVMSGASFGMDLTPLMNDPNIPPMDYVNAFIQRFSYDVRERMVRMS
jgi:LmbE family N-acetylglucosaminyl deacetylase